MFLLLKVGRIMPETGWCQYQSVIVTPTAIVQYQIRTDPFWHILSEPTLGEGGGDNVGYDLYLSDQSLGVFFSFLVFSLRIFAVNS